MNNQENNAQPPKQFIIGEQLAQALGNYLVTKPFIEVAGLIRGLEQLVQIPTTPPPAGNLDIQGENSELNN
jgi:hypothetical protein